jgi:hypothetical protein
MKLDTFNTPKNTPVRQGYTEQDTWRDCLGNTEPLHCFASLGYCLDAPIVLPAGGMRSGTYGNYQLHSFRY